MEALTSKITFVTSNAGKLKEVQAILSSKQNCKITIVGNAFDLPEYQGDMEYISKEKCRAAACVVNGPVFVEDTHLGVFTNRALCFESLGGMPGPYIKWFLESIGCDGLAKLLNGFENRKAWAQTTFSYTTGDKDAPIHTFVGKTYGNIVPPRGVSKFGGISWDPVFEPFSGENNDEPGNQTYAEMTSEEKNRISHRNKALKALTNYLDEHPPC